jgi:tRNA(Ile)-lysidine synthase
MLDCSIFDQYTEAVSTAPVCYVGFSGGLDSTVLLHLAAAWHADNPRLPPLRAIHINHQMQVPSDSWQAHCQSICDRLGIPLEIHCVDVVAAGGGEAGARKARYAVFEQCLDREGGGVLLLGHHQDDQVETFFLRLMRGAGLEGLSAMPALRGLGQGVIIRPLLHSPRHELEAFAGAGGLVHIEDPSNADTSMDRNFLRNEVLKLLETRWPAYRDTVTRASTHIAEASSVLHADLGHLDERRTITGDAGLALHEVLGRSSEEARRVLRFWIRGRGLQAPDQSVLTEFVRQLSGAVEGSSPSMNVGSYAVSRYGDAIYLHAPPAEIAAMAPVQLTLGVDCQIAGVGSLCLSVTEGAGITLPASGQLQVRLRSGGERCRIAGRGHSTSLKNVFQELSVPPWWRERIPLIYAGDDLVAVGDLLLCEPSSVANEAVQNTGWKLIWQRESTPFD